MLSCFLYSENMSLTLIISQRTTQLVTHISKAGMDKIGNTANFFQPSDVEYLPYKSRISTKKIKFGGVSLRIILCFKFCDRSVVNGE